MNKKFTLGFTLAIILAMAMSMVALASSVDESIVDTTAPTGSVTLNPGGSGPITIKLTVTGNQVGTATFDVYRNWALSGGTFTGSNPQTFTVNPRDAQDAPTTFSTSGTVTVAAGQAAGTFTLAVGAFNITNTNTTGAKLGAGAASNYQITVEIPTPSDTAAPNISCSPPADSAWYGVNVSVPCTASDSESGLANPADASFSLSTSVAGGVEMAAASTGTHQVCDNAGNCATAGPYSFMVDKKSPQLVSCDSPDGLWHAEDVTLQCSYSDGGSGPASQSVALVTSVASGAETSNAIASASGAQACDAVGNCAASPADIDGNLVDKKAPQLVSCDAPDGQWHAANVTLKCYYSDDGAGLVTSEVSLVTNVAAGNETANAFASAGGVQACDTVGNCAASPDDIGGNKIDKKAPQVTSCDAADGQWHDDDVTLKCHYSDGGSGLTSSELSLVTSVDIGDETANAFASAGGAYVCDMLGNCADSPADIGGNKVDKKAPQLVSCDSPDGLWHAEDVTLQCSYSDGGSGPASQDVALQTSVASGTETDSAIASANGTRACDAVGNCAASPDDIAGNMIDKKAPTNIAFVGGGISDGGEYYFAFVPEGPSGCTADDGGSGMAKCEVIGYATTVGPHTLTATATDNVGNSDSVSISYKVLSWNLNGFYKPVDMNGVFNVAKNGSTIPFKFEIFAGDTELTDTSYISKEAWSLVACDADADTDAIEVYATGGTSLRYDTTAGQFVFNWKTPANPGKCYKFRVTTIDGSFLTAFFKLK